MQTILQMQVLLIQLLEVVPSWRPCQVFTSCFLLLFGGVQTKTHLFFLGLFTLGIGALFKVEKLNLLKIFAVFIR